MFKLKEKKTKRSAAIEIFSRHFVKHQSGFYSAIDPRRPYFLFRTAVLNELMTVLGTSKSGASCLFNDIRTEVSEQYPETLPWLTRDPNITPNRKERVSESKDVRSVSVDRSGVSHVSSESDSTELV